MESDKASDKINDIENLSEDSKTKLEERIRTHTRLLKYMENKRLKEELDFIDNY